MVALCVVVALVAGVLGAVLVRWLWPPPTQAATNGGESSTTQAATSATAPETGTGTAAGAAPIECDTVTLADKVLPSVVTINVTSSGNARSNGSGEVVRDDGYILTNDHVISAGVDGGSFSVLFSGGQTMDATVVGRAIGLDLAVLKVNADKPLPVIAIGSSAVPIGLPVVALGSPLGLDGSVSRGIVSALGRDVTLPAAGGTTALIPDGIQTDAAINPGNSGGPLVDCDGAMIGVNTAIATIGGGSNGIGFAIPSDLASAVADQLISTGKFAMPSFGLSVVPISGTIAQRFGLPAGLFVRAITPGGGAEAAGLQEGDVITAIDGKDATDDTVLIRSALSHEVGDKVPVTYYRDGKSVDTTVTLT